MFGNIRNLLRFKPRKFLGVDIGTVSIRVVELGRRGQAYRLENYGEVGLSFVRETPFRVYKKDTLLLSNKKIAKAINTICKEAGVQTKEANFSIPDFCTFSTSFELPPMDREEIPEAINYEVRPYIPLPLSEITLDWSVISGQIGRTSLKVLVVAVPNDVIAQYQEIAQLSDLELRFLEPEIFSLVRSLIKDKAAKDQKVISLIDIGARSTTCNILEKGVLKISHTCAVAGNELTEIIARSSNMDYNKAEELKKKFGLLLDNKVRGKDVRKIIIPLVDSILEEIKKVFRNFYQSDGKEIEEIVLAGGTALMPGLKEYFSTELKKEVKLANPFLGIACPPVLLETLEEMGPSYAIAVGVALKGLE